MRKPCRRDFIDSGQAVEAARIGAYAMMALPRNTQSKMALKTESAKSPPPGEPSSRRNCLSNNS
jgi:hypothetical protein